MTDIEALRARMREAAEKAAGSWPVMYGTDYIDAVSPANVKALDAYTTRLRDDLDRVTREKDGAGKTPEVLRLIARAEAAEAALAKRDEEVKAWMALALHLRECLGAEGDSVWHRVHKSVTPEEALADLKGVLTKEPTNAE